jgi:hypothetical protein
LGVGHRRVWDIPSLVAVTVTLVFFVAMRYPLRHFLFPAGHRLSPKYVATTLSLSAIARGGGQWRPYNRVSQRSHLREGIPGETEGADAESGRARPARRTERPVAFPDVDGYRHRQGRGDWTPVKLFLQGAASIPPAARRLILAFIQGTPPQK